MIADGVSFGATSPTHWLAFEPRYELAEGRNIRQRLGGVRQSSPPSCAQAAGFDVPERRCQFGERHLDLPAGADRSTCGRRTTIGHVGQIGAGHQFEIFPDDVRRRSVCPPEPIAIFAGGWPLA